MALAVSTVVAGIGVAVSAGGLAYSISQNKKAADANAAASATQGQIAQLQAGNVDIEKQQLALQTQQNLLQVQTNKNVINQQQAADDIRQQAAQLDATRRIRESIRTGIVASGTSLNNAANSGANDPGSTAFRQSQANIQGQTNVNISGVNQNADAGRQIYGINKSISQTYLQAQDQNASYVQQAQALQDEVLSTQKKIYSLGGSISNDYATAALASGNAAIGQGIAGFGGSLVSNSKTVGQLTSYFSNSLGNAFIPSSGVGI